MGPQRLLLNFLVILFMGFTFSLSRGYNFYVGGQDGWILNPKESYNDWAGRNRFQVNDTLYFKYNNESDSVLTVNEDDYDNCSTGNPIQSLTDGNSTFKFNRSGPFFFVTGNVDNCKKGQRLIIVVLSTCHHNKCTPTAPPSSPPQPPQVPLPAPVPAPAPAPAAPNSGSHGFSSSIGFVLGSSVVSCVMLSGFGVIF